MGKRSHIHPASIVARNKGHPPFKCWRRLEAKCSKCQQMGHEAIICRNKRQHNDEEAKVVRQDEEDYLFVATFNKLLTH